MPQHSAEWHSKSVVFTVLLSVILLNVILYEWDSAECHFVYYCSVECQSSECHSAVILWSFCCHSAVILWSFCGHSAVILRSFCGHSAECHYAECYTVDSYSAEWHSAEGNFLKNAIRLSVILMIAILLIVIWLWIIWRMSFFADCHSVEYNPGESHYTMCYINQLTSIVFCFVFLGWMLWRPKKEMSWMISPTLFIWFLTRKNSEWEFKKLLQTYSLLFLKFLSDVDR